MIRTKTPKTKDMSSKAGTVYGEFLNDDTPYDWYVLPVSFREAMLACAPFIELQPQWDDKHNTEVGVIYDRLGIHDIYKKLGRAMDNRVGKQVAMTAYVMVFAKIGREMLSPEKRDRLIQEWAKLKPGYAKANGIDVHPSGAVRLASVFVVLAASVTRLFKQRRAYPKRSRYHKKEDQVIAMRKMYPGWNPEDE